eukprot:164397-Hanusia_phi.AAC.1
MMIRLGVRTLLLSIVELRRAQMRLNLGTSRGSESFDGDRPPAAQSRWQVARTPTPVTVSLAAAAAGPRAGLRVSCCLQAHAAAGGRCHESPAEAGPPRYLSEEAVCALKMG